MATYLRQRAAYDVDEIHIAEGGDEAEHITDDGVFCSCLPKAIWGAICPDRRIMVEGTASPDWPLVKIIQHNRTD